MSSLDDKAPLQIGDIVDFWIPDKQDEAFALKVREDGCILAPYVGLILVEGHTCREVAFMINKLLVEKDFDHIDVMIALVYT